MTFAARQVCERMAQWPMVLALMDDMESNLVVPDKADYEPHDSLR